MPSAYQSPERILSSPSRESTPEPSQMASEPVKVDELNVTELIKHNPLTTHPFLSDEQLIEAKCQLHKECEEVTKKLIKKRNEWRSAVEEHKTERIKFKTHDFKVKGEKEEYEKRNAAFITLRDTELKEMWSKRSFKPGQRVGNVKTFGDYDRNRLFAMLEEDDAVVQMHNELSTSMERNEKMKNTLDESKTKRDVAKQELRDAENSYKQAYEKLGSVVEQVYSNMLEDDEDVPEVKRVRFADQIDCHPSSLLTPSTSTQCAPPAKNGASGTVTPKQETGKKRK